MLGWALLIGALAVLALIGAYLSHRVGRGAYETTFKDPGNETQTTTPWKIWP
ncbi:MAG TPA: hypothetical protein VMM78_04130 [Thermomicrobiales bacterium]|nr:hypothetical protein [Thermomicrobiales bacterium]